MKCKCGKEIQNVPEHLSHLVDWVCRECSNTPPASSLVSIGVGGNLETNFDLNKTIKAETAA